MKMTYYSRGNDRAIEWESHFCGEGIDVTNNGKPIETGCHWDKQQPANDIESCFCQDNHCNGANGYQVGVAVLVISVMFGFVR